MSKKIQLNVKKNKKTLKLIYFKNDMGAIVGWDNIRWFGEAGWAKY
jgi:hypothetical protein